MSKFARQDDIYSVLDSLVRRVTSLERTFTNGDIAGVVSGLHTLSAEASGTLTLTNAFQDIPGATVTTPNDGLTRTWLIIGVFELSANASSVVLGGINVGGTDQTEVAVSTNPAGSGTTITTVSQVWIRSLAPNTSLTLRAAYLSGTGSASPTHTTINAISTT